MASTDSSAASRSVGTRLRRAFVWAACAVVLCAVAALVLTLLGVVPVRAYVMQRDELDATRARLDMLTERNTALRARAHVLQTDGEVQRIALDQFGMVEPGQSLTVIPGLRSDGSVLDTTRLDRVVAPAPSATAPQRVSRSRAILDALQFWR